MNFYNCRFENYIWARMPPTETLAPCFVFPKSLPMALLPGIKKPPAPAGQNAKQKLVMASTADQYRKMSTTSIQLGLVLASFWFETRHQLIVSCLVLSKNKYCIFSLKSSSAGLCCCRFLHRHPWNKNCS